MAVEILHEDAHLFGCVKPVGVISEDGGMPELILAQTGKKAYCVHRLDKETGGCMVYAKNGKAAALLTEIIAKHEAVKEYFCVIEGEMPEKNAELRDLLYHDKAKNKTYVVNRERKGVKEALLAYETIAVCEKDGKTLSLLKVRIFTGRSHQIRVQFASRKHPLIGDGKYGSSVKGVGMALWSFRYSFLHPVTKKNLTIQKVPPEDGAWAAFKSDIQSHMEICSGCGANACINENS